MKLQNNFKRAIVTTIATFTIIAAFSQTSDSLTLTQIITQVVNNHPSIKEASEALNDADAKIAIARTNYNPNVDFTGSFTRIGPVSEMTLPGLGTFKLYPENNYNASIKVSQTIYDFGKTAKTIEFETESKNLATQTIEQAKQKLATAVIGNYYAILYLQKAIAIKEQQLKTLNEHLVFVQKKKETGTGTDYEILTTQVKISTIESQKSDLETGLHVQLSVLNSLMGVAQTTKPTIKENLTFSANNLTIDSLVAKAFNQRDEMKIVQEKSKIAQLRYTMIKRQDAPYLGAFAEGGIKNGYIPDLNKPTPNYAIGVALKVPIFDANREKYNLARVQTSIESNGFETESIRRTITNDVIENDANTQLSLKKISQFELQLKQSQKALELAETSFRNGVITNLDLLDATTSVSECRLQLLKAKIDYVVNNFKLKVALGERLY